MLSPLIIWFFYCFGGVDSFAFVARNRRTRPASSQSACVGVAAEKKYDAQLVLIDHYDSYTYNLYDMLADICTDPPFVISKDFEGPLPANDGIVLSPGPGRPSCPSDMGRTIEVLQNYTDTPILGVCLGHQAMAHIYGATVDVAPGGPVHGQIHKIRHNSEDAIWNGIPQDIEVTRYHSLSVQSLEGTPLIPTAWYGEDLIMGLSHPERPHYGLQFHPESIGTSNGRQMLENFVKICTKQADHPPALHLEQTEEEKTQQRVMKDTDSTFLVEAREIKDVSALPQQVFEDFYGENKEAVWLDSSSSAIRQTKLARYSIMGGMTGPSSLRIEYFGKEQHLNQQGIFVTDINGETTKLNATILEYLETSKQQAEIKHNFALPFNGGYLGYLGYEVRFDTHIGEVPAETTHEEGVPTAAFLFCDQALIFDHWTDTWYLVTVTNGQPQQHQSWLDETERKLRQMIPVFEGGGSYIETTLKCPSKLFVPKRGRQIYEANIDECHEQIRLGESYELCLTDRFETQVSKASTFNLYKILRQRNPAPFSAFLNLFSERSRLSLCCSSPERFLSINQSPLEPSKLRVEAKPIKGTAARPPLGNNPTEENILIDGLCAAELQSCEKNRAENLMIVDLLRNDLSRVCEIGSVHVPKLMRIESFATVHQMVSTIRGHLDPEKTNAVNVLNACFPGGSMTGAPKLRTMEILHRMEEGVCRGPYSGCLGYLSLDGTMDMNIIIRTAAVTEKGDGLKVTISAGGAITALSECDDEYNEMLLKARAIKESVQIWCNDARGAREQNGKNSTIVSVM